MHANHSQVFPEINVDLQLLDEEFDALEPVTPPQVACVSAEILYFLGNDVEE
jgi:hypothetical protein